MKKLKLFFRRLYFRTISSNPSLQADLFFSVGRACRPAFYLRRFGIRMFSSPFDWMMDYKLETVIRLFEEGFDSFFVEVEDLTENVTKYRSVRDCRNGITDIHHFPRSMSVESVLPEFRTTMTRRFNRLMTEIKNSKKVVIFSHRNDDWKIYEDLVRRLYRIHPAEYVFLNVRDLLQEPEESRPMPGLERTKLEDIGAEIIEHRFADTLPKRHRVRGNYNEWGKIAACFKLRK